jgi:hypothetical protein
MEFVGFDFFFRYYKNCSGNSIFYEQMQVQKKIDHYWKKAGFTPTENQKQAIIHSKGPLLLTADYLM